MALPVKWHQWVLDNLMRGVSASTLLPILLENGFAFEQCRRVLGRHLPESERHLKDAVFYRKLAEAPLRAGNVGLEALESEKAQLFRIQQFLSADECQHLMRLTEHKLRPSELASTTSDRYFRTSSTGDLENYDDPFIGELNQRIAQTLGLDHSYGEPIQAQRYLQGQQFKAHTDYFEPATDEYAHHAKQRGQRSWTLMIYLNQDCGGGETEFPRLSLSVVPLQGMALLWNNLDADGVVNGNTLHHAHPVSDGRKYVITKWFRDQAYE
ncbi:Procollagen-proline dioxygenase [Saliniradius amylolyticus]|uniref:Procollagen-proline dioxygenase n=1 Tax=Saliniradius amylolyticus TaxID=2183582 RepID=A0A2S2E0I3_9ALTE|nr:2OG-Fe(II) oxygenase [Saliniradius amylolyticus]AWL11109.1 Procollagen-proline dioxygenase [Saliniradius amylolyticus]